MPQSKLRLGFIGAGQMATALARGFANNQLVTADQVSAADPFASSRQRFSDAIIGSAVGDKNGAVAGASDVCILAVKPAQVLAVLHEIRDQLRPEALVVSIAAGVTLGQLAGGLREGTRVVRVMPNTPCLIGRGASAFARGEHATDGDAKLVGELLSAVGMVHEVPEKLLDAVTGLSGSGPAFVYTVIEALSDGGVRAGLPRELAASLAAQTVAGAAEMVLATGEHPAKLRDAVTSPGGTTIAGLEALEHGGLRAALIAAVREATNRATELGKGGA